MLTVDEAMNLYREKNPQARFTRGRGNGTIFVFDGKQFHLVCKRSKDNWLGIGHVKSNGSKIITPNHSEIKEPV